MISKEPVLVSSTLVLSGIIDISMVSDLYQRLMLLADARVTPVIIDVTGVLRMDTAGVATLVACLRHIRSYGGKLNLVGMNQDTRDVIGVSGVAALLDPENAT